MNGTVHASHLHFAVQGISRSKNPKETDWPFTDISQCHKFPNKMSATLRLNGSPKRRLPTWWVICIKDEGTRLANQEANFLARGPETAELDLR